MNTGPDPKEENLISRAMDGVAGEALTAVVEIAGQALTASGEAISCAGEIAVEVACCVAGSMLDGI